MTNHSRLVLLALCPAWALAMLWSRPLRADSESGAAQVDTTQYASLPGAPVLSIFHIEKSENRNQVHYAMRVDDACHPVGARPVYGYWRELERGPNVVSELLQRERPAYGLSEPRSIRRTPEGGQVQVSLRAFPQRPLTIHVFRAANGCSARALVTIQKQAAMLTTIRAEVGLLGVSHALVRGLRVSDGHALQEKLYPEP